jgi:hypothetical protein
MGGDMIAGAIWYIAMPVEEPSTASKADIMIGSNSVDFPLLIKPTRRFVWQHLHGA